MYRQKEKEFFGDLHQKNTEILSILYVAFFGKEAYNGLCNMLRMRQKMEESYMKKFLALLLSLLMVLSLVACGDGGTTKDNGSGFSGDYLMGTGGATGNYYAFGNSVSTVLNKVLGCNITVNSTGGSTENARLLGSGENEFAMIQSDVYSYAQEGIELFEDGAITNFQAITACYPEMVQIVVRKGSGIQSVADMKGKNVCVGDVGSGYEVAARQILGAYGMTYDDINETFADQSTARNGVQDGTFDAMFMCSGYPNSNVVEMSLNGKIDVISIDQEHLDILTAQYPFYSAFDPEDNQYNLDHNLVSVAVKCMLVCSDKFSEDEIYALTKALYENLDDVREINAKANYMSLESALNGIPSNLHPGAAKYYKEQGITIPDYLQ